MRPEKSLNSFNLTQFNLTIIMEKEHWEYLSYLVECQRKEINNSILMRPNFKSELNKINVIDKYIDNILNVGDC
tara:strand:+ start:301 stop:522 length:222 start_codon:yes stop_codon:yes gene_type:complete